MASSPHYKGEFIHGETYFKDPNGRITLYPRALDVTWGTDSRYWRLPPRSRSPDSSREPLELVQVCWLEVSGSIDPSMLDMNRKYKVSFKVTMKPDAFGWADNPVYLMVKPNKKERYIWRTADLSKVKTREAALVPMDKELGFEAKDGDGEGDKLRFGMYEIWRGRWKGGLLIHEVVIEPCNLSL